MGRYSRFLDALLEVALSCAPGAEDPAPLPAFSFGKPPRPEQGDLALPAFPLAKRAGAAPEALATAWAARLEAERARTEGRFSGLEIPVTRASALGPYVNLTLDPDALARTILADVQEEGASYGRADRPSGQTVVLEYSGPNTNKPLHLGHLRNNVLGMSLSNLLEAAGHRVFRVNMVNDRGIHISKSMLAYQRHGNGETPESTGEKGDHFVGRYYVRFDEDLKAERAAFAAARGVDLARFSKEALRALADKNAVKVREAEAEAFDRDFESSSSLMAAIRSLLKAWEAGDPEVRALWARMNDWVYAGFKATYDRLGCRFDKWYLESDTWQLGKELVERGLESGVFYRKEDGSVWAALERVGRQDRVVLRSDGTTVYLTQDLGTALQRYRDYQMDRLIYVVASEQETHFQNLFATLKLLGHDWAALCHHASYGLITLPKGMGKLKSREGTKVDVDDLLDELARSALAKIEEGGYSESPEDAKRTAEIIGQGAVKLYLLQVSAEKNIEFDPTETISFTGDTGPAVQYSHARIEGILRKGRSAGTITDADLGRAGGEGSGPFLRAERVDPALLMEAEERAVLRLLPDLESVVRASAQKLSTAPLASYLLDLTKAYARMYHEHEVLRAASPELLRARLQLSLCVAQVLRNGLGLLTIEAPDRM